MPHPGVSSLHAIWAPDWQEALRRYTIVSKSVLVPQVAIVAVPEVAGVHWKTFSGELLLVAHVPLSVLVPLVVPLKVPPAAGMAVLALQALGTGVGVAVAPVEVGVMVGVGVRVGVRVAVAPVGVAVVVGAAGGVTAKV